ncbi:zinc finger C-x8-C-x5-C-x3-H type family protein [Striga asiatica]|uniref:Zinc finger C-x8-C-x5-C-x3-H type family protein n=1 Tax=Striga asiatica TaxID=4170 RepID=A0A5A7QVH0_STRAF|nr:zinc finger C-x8-C-x5-C-x3-H type family protein [Striga asiatica]
MEFVYGEVLIKGSVDYRDKVLLSVVEPFFGRLEKYNLMGLDVFSIKYASPVLFCLDFGIAEKNYCSVTGRMAYCAVSICPLSKEQNLQVTSFRESISSFHEQASCKPMSYLGFLLLSEFSTEMLCEFSSFHEQARCYFRDV